ncbi:Uncharacterised protein [Vibrio cholerae]|nr:Uncharacterised protein [Vibrio cholerae]
MVRAPTEERDVTRLRNSILSKALQPIHCTL